MGAGKSTYGQALLPTEFNNLNIFDGDIYYTRKSIEFYKQTRSSKESRKLAEEALEIEFLKLVELSISQRENFAYEGHFTGSGAWQIPQRFKEVGFEINLIFCGLSTVKQSIQRVDTRVKKGGFHVTALAIENNYWGNMEMLDKNFFIFDSVEIIDTSSPTTSIAKIETGIVITAITIDQLPVWFSKGMPTITALVEAFHKK
jgi:predicted ABC-type ATPase